MFVRGSLEAFYVRRNEKACISGTSVIFRSNEKHFFFNTVIWLCMVLSVPLLLFKCMLSSLNLF